MQNNNKIIELIEQAACSANMLSPADLSELGKLQTILNQINKNIAEINDIPPQLLEQAKGSTSEAAELLRKILQNQVEDTSKSIKSVSQAISALQSLIEQIEQIPKTAGSKVSQIIAAETESPQHPISEEDVPLVLDFINESKEHIESAEAGLLELETKPDDKEVLYQIFREFHTIKGMAWLLNLTDIGSLAHSAENMLDLVRKGELILAGKHTDVVFKSIDMLKKMITDLEKSVETHKVYSRNRKDNTMFKAKNIMTTNVISVNRQTDIYDAIRTLVENNITGLPVVNDDMSIVGIISEKDVLNLLYDADNKEGKVEDFMTKGIVGFNEDDSLIDITECLIDNNFRRVPITADGKLVGIISRRDIIAHILKLRHKDTAAVRECLREMLAKDSSCA